MEFIIFSYKEINGFSRDNSSNEIFRNVIILVMVGHNLDYKTKIQPV